jgi:predicted outer membrane repeat protein
MKRRNFIQNTGKVTAGGILIPTIVPATVLGINSIDCLQLRNPVKFGNTNYIDPKEGDDANDGLSPENPIKTYVKKKFSGGDKVLFKCGSIIRDMLYTCNGETGAAITYGAYGDGEKPAFLGSVEIADQSQWINEKPFLWRYTGKLSSEVCNLIFNDGESCGNLRWCVDDLQSPGEWYYTEIGKRNGNGILYLYSNVNPGQAYNTIECSLWGKRKLTGGQRHIILENLSFRYTGVHGYQDSNVHDVVIRNCDFRFIGGAVHTLEKKVRFGNGVEFWNGASKCTVENCLFYNIYDAGVTHQGGETHNIPEHIYFRNNLFINCGLAAYECREPAREVYFENNTCIYSGGGFHMQGESPPRITAIYLRTEGDELLEMVSWPTPEEVKLKKLTPIDVGHHVFVWMIDRGTQPGHVYIRNNIFYETPYGGSFYAIIFQQDLRKFILENNCYWQTTGELLIYMSGQKYSPKEFHHYQDEWGQDLESQIKRPLFVDEANGDYRQLPDSPCHNQGMKNIYCNY